MPQNDQIKYNVKVLLDPNTQTDSSVIYNATDKKFELGTGTGITIINYSNNNILTATDTQTTIIGESYFRYVDGGTGGTNEGRVAIGTYDSPTPYLPLDVGRNVTDNSISNFPQALFYSTNTNFNKGLKIGLQRIPVEIGSSTNYVLHGVLGVANKLDDADDDIYIGTFSNMSDSATFDQNAVFGHNVTFGLGYREKAGIAYSETPTIVKVNNSYLTSTFTVGDDVTATSTPGGRNQVAQITNYNTSGFKDNVVLELRLAATDGTSQDWDGSSGNYGDNCRFISFKRRATISENATYNTNWIECGKIVLNGAEAGSPSGESFPGVYYLETSDKRFKKNIKPFSIGLNELLKIQPSEYTWQNSTKVNKGFLAQDLYKIYPDAVYKPADETDLSDPWSVDYGKLTPLLVQSIKDQQKIIEELKERITKLEKLIK